jgi:hypothetical protein
VRQTGNVGGRVERLDRNPVRRVPGQGVRRRTVKLLRSCRTPCAQVGACILCHLVSSRTRRSGQAIHLKSYTGLRSDAAGARRFATKEIDVALTDGGGRVTFRRAAARVLTVFRRSTLTPSVTDHGHSDNSNFYALVERRFPADLDLAALRRRGLVSWRDLAARQRPHRELARIAAACAGSARCGPGGEVAGMPDALSGDPARGARLSAAQYRLPARRDRILLADAEPTVLVCTPGRRDESSPCAQGQVPPRLHAGESRDGSLLEAAAAHADGFATRLRAADDLAAICTRPAPPTQQGCDVDSPQPRVERTDAGRVLGLRASAEGRQDVLLHALPLFHVHGLFVASHAALLAGARMLFLPKFDAAQVLERLPRSTVFMGVPTYYTRLLSEARLVRALCSRMRLFISGSAPLLADTHRDF